MMRFYKKGSRRTVVLAVLATATFVGAAIGIFDVEPRVMLEFFLVSLLGLLVIISAAFVLVFVWQRIARWLKP